MLSVRKRRFSYPTTAMSTECLITAPAVRRRVQPQALPAQVFSTMRLLRRLSPRRSLIPPEALLVVSQRIIHTLSQYHDQLMLRQRPPHIGALITAVRTAVSTRS